MFRDNFTRVAFLSLLILCPSSSLDAGIRGRNLTDSSTTRSLDSRIDNFADQFNGEEEKSTGDVKPMEIFQLFGSGSNNGALKYAEPAREKRNSMQSDEDLFEFMVRIANTPAEWERIRRVLSRIKSEESKAKYDYENPVPPLSARPLVTDDKTDNFSTGGDTGGGIGRHIGTESAESQADKLKAVRNGLSDDWIGKFGDHLLNGSHYEDVINELDDELYAIDHDDDSGDYAEALLMYKKNFSSTAIPPTVLTKIGENSISESNNFRKINDVGRDGGVKEKLEPRYPISYDSFTVDRKMYPDIPDRSLFDLGKSVMGLSVTDSSAKANTGKYSTGAESAMETSKRGKKRRHLRKKYSRNA